MSEVSPLEKLPKHSHRLYGLVGSLITNPMADPYPAKLVGTEKNLPVHFRSWASSEKIPGCPTEPRRIFQQWHLGHHVLALARLPGEPGEYDMPTIDEYHMFAFGSVTLFHMICPNPARIRQTGEHLIARNAMLSNPDMIKSEFEKGIIKLRDELVRNAHPRTVGTTSNLPQEEIEKLNDRLQALVDAPRPESSPS
jgi:hypothetical protein